MAASARTGSPERLHEDRQQLGRAGVEAVERDVQRLPQLRAPSKKQIITRFASASWSCLLRASLGSASVSIAAVSSRWARSI